MSSIRVSLFISVLIFSLSNFSQVTTEDLSGDYVRIEREAKSFVGFYYGLKEKDQLKRYRLQGCNFLYEKGIGQHPKTEKDYAYERFMVSFSGVDKNKVISFDSVLYGHSAYVSNFKTLDFSKSFDFKSIKRIELDNAKEAGQIKAIRTDFGELHLIFRHKEVYDSEKSSFFSKDEQRDYQLEVQFSQFNPKKIKLKKVLVNTTQRIKGKKSKKIVEVVCENFNKI
ncbi:MAG: hypothetical protein K9K67_06240 [Bacteriovoracaceae bacterium]|nr:hypothetical protein [Bacteriovoracaceae bacterium]